MKTNSTIDTARLGILLNELRLPAIKLLWCAFQPIVITDSRPS